MIDATWGRRDNRPVRGWAAIAVAFAATGCGFDLTFGTGGPDGGSGGSNTGDGGGSATGDGGFGCYGTGIVVVCPLTQPPLSYDVTVPVTIDTNVTGNCTAVNGTNVGTTCVIIAENVNISANVRGVGPRPIVIVATETMRISATIDVASHGTSLGAGVSTSGCSASAGPEGLSGGAGGSFGGQGGLGGNSQGGTPGPMFAPVSLRGGCRGQAGAGPFGVEGDGGFAGGGFYAIAGTAIEMMGSINASGAGGDGANAGGLAGAGGGGGGSGGMIVLDAPQVTVTGELFANGGGGGGGSSQFENAGNGHESASALATPGGGTNAFTAGEGGVGAFASSINGSTGGNDTGVGVGGGGGGGGAGFIKIYGTASISGHISPPPS